jgi:ribosomal protein S18 acetylase RimI-like enzyme
MLVIMNHPASCRFYACMEGLACQTTISNHSMLWWPQESMTFSMINWDVASRIPHDPSMWIVQLLRMSQPPDKFNDEPDMKIRSFQLSDQKRVVELWIKCGLVVSHNNPIRDVERKLIVNPEWFLVGEINGEVIATCMAGYEGHRGWINYLAVRPDLQGHGFGKMIVEYAEAMLKAAGCPKINLQVRSTNQNVISFYERIGYRQDAVVSMGKRLIPDQPCPEETGGVPELLMRPDDF